MWPRSPATRTIGTRVDASGAFGHGSGPCLGSPVEVQVLSTTHSHPHPRRRSATLQERVEQPPNTLRALPGRRNPGPPTGDRGGSTFGQMVEPTGIEPVTSCLQNKTAPQWISLVFPAHRHYPGLRQISGHWLIWAHFGWV